MIESLASELARVGIRGRLRRRILAEVADHLACDPDARLGEPRELAREFADELGASRSRLAAYASFGALAVAGCLFSACFVAANVATPGVVAAPARTHWLGLLAVAAAIGGSQFAVVAGGLALVRAARFRRARTLPAGEVQLLLRRSAVALAAGLVTMAGVALLGYEYSSSLPGWLRLLAWLGAAVGAASLVAAAGPIARAARVRVSLAGDTGDVFDDLGPIVPAGLRGHPWRFALAVAAAVLVAVTAAGVAQSDPIDGALRGLLEAAACLAGFAALGRLLGLRTSMPAPK